MPSQAFPSYNGDSPSWADITVTLAPTGGDLLETADIAAINHSGTVEVGEQRGASGGRVMKFTKGSVSYEGSLTLYLEGYLRFMRSLVALAPERGNQRPISGVKFDILIQYTPQGSDEIFQTHMKGCRVTGKSSDNAEGTDAQQVELTLAVLEIVELIDGVEVPLL